MNPCFRYSFAIADLVLALRTTTPITVTAPFLPFCTDAEADYTAIFQEVSSLPAVSGRQVYKAISYTVIQNQAGKYWRLFYDAAHETPPYAVSRVQWDSRQVLIDYLPEGRPFVNESNNCFFHTFWETILLREHRLILHAACVDTPLGGILFSGRSGIGKSTQADLWCRYADARQINGDRPILHKAETIWYAYGSPYAGSSKYHVNTKCPIRAIIMLQQASECKIRRLGMADAFRKLFSGLTVSNWNPVCMEMANDLTAELAFDVPVYELACTPDLNAVDLLWQELSRGANR